MSCVLGFVFILVAITLMPVDANSRVKRVVGGDVYEDGDYPFHVSLWYMGENNPYTNRTPDLDHTCGGSLIDPQWVLTAAACFDYELIPNLNDTSLWEVVLGMYDQRGASDVATFMTIDSVFHPPEYNLSVSHADIALLKLTERAPLGDRIDLIDYNTNDDCPSADVTAEVIGWGQTDDREYGLGSDYPYVAEVNVTSVDYCHDVYEEVEEEMGGFVVSSLHICAGMLDGSANACYGDAGSPLLYQCDGRLTVAGVVSLGYGCTVPRFPAVYTRVSAFSDWIADTVRENS